MSEPEPSPLFGSVEAAMPFIMCDVCYREYDHDERLPKVLLCGHTFCESCIQRLNSITPSRFACPTCRYEVGRPYNLLAFPTNYTVLRCVQPMNRNDPLTLFDEIRRHFMAQQQLFGQLENQFREQSTSLEGLSVISKQLSKENTKLQTELTKLKKENNKRKNEMKSIQKRDRKPVVKQEPKTPSTAPGKRPRGRPRKSAPRVVKIEPAEPAPVETGPRTRTTRNSRGLRR